MIYESSQEDNDRFLRFKKIDANGKIQNISKKSNKENIEALVKWTKEKKISKDVITPEIAERLIVEWNDKHEVQINSLLLGRAVYGEISSTIRLLPIENLKKDLSGMQDIDSNRKEVIDTYLHNLDETYGKLEKISNSPQLEECKRNAKSYIEK